MMVNISVSVPSPVCVQESESSKYTGSSESMNIDLLLLNCTSNYFLFHPLFSLMEAYLLKRYRTYMNGANLMMPHYHWYSLPVSLYGSTALRTLAAFSVS
jgi:hypothetical protein